MNTPNKKHVSGNITTSLEKEKLRVMKNEGVSREGKRFSHKSIFDFSFLTKQTLIIFPFNLQVDAPTISFPPLPFFLHSLTHATPCHIMLQLFHYHRPVNLHHARHTSGPAIASLTPSHANLRHSHASFH